MYHDAIQCFTRCLVHGEASTTTVVYSYRGETCTHNTESILESLFTSSFNLRIHIAMAHLKLKNWLNAEADTTAALEINPTHSKSYQRRSVARLSLGKLRATMMDACVADDCLDANQECKVFKEVRRLQQRVQSALLHAVKCAPSITKRQT